MISESVIKNRFGNYEIIKKPSVTILAKYYSEKYYNKPKGSYQESYSKEELTYNENKYKVFRCILNSIQNKDKKTLRDIGCGEGFLLNSFYN
ncbi:MAG: hypothetical protein VW378_05350 [bacterium]